MPVHGLTVELPYIQTTFFSQNWKYNFLLTPNPASRRRVRLNALLAQHLRKLYMMTMYIYMIYWNQVFDWDIGNERKSETKHAVTRLEAEQVFFNRPLLILPDTKHSQKKAQHHALGKTDESRLLHITFTLRFDMTMIRVISARSMHKRES